MSAADALDLTRAAIRLTLTISAPIVLAVMLVGVLISLFQALTQIQEMTLTFVPKMIVALGVILVAAPFIGNSLMTFADHTYGKIEQTGRQDYRRDRP